MTNIFKFFLTLALIVSVGIVASAQDAAKKKVAVYMTGKDINEAYKKVIGAKLVSAITESGEYAAVERTADFLAALSAENDYQTSGEVRDSQIAALGQKFGVEYVAVADVSEVFNEYFITARMINVETGLVEKAFDTNGPAESMAQLVSLSKSVATGLLKGLSSSQTAFLGAPVHLSLCVKDRNGKTQYITAEQWQGMSVGNRFNYTKQGVVVMNGDMAIIVEMRDRSKGTYEWAKTLDNLPNGYATVAIEENIENLNEALRIFGGTPLRDETYWCIISNRVSMFNPRRPDCAYLFTYDDIANVREIVRLEP